MSQGVVFKEPSFMQGRAHGAWKNDETVKMWKKKRKGLSWMNVFAPKGRSKKKTGSKRKEQIDSTKLKVDFRSTRAVSQPDCFQQGVLD